MNPAEPFWVAGRRMTGEATVAVDNKWTHEPMATVSVPTDEHVGLALDAAAAVRRQAQNLPAHVRADALAHVAQRIRDRKEEFAALISAEGGKPMRLAVREVERSISTFRTAGEESRRWDGELQRLDGDAAGEGRLGLVRRFPHGVVLAVTPFNFPLNLVAHKVAPALAVGAPIIVKPAPSTPLTSLLLGDVLAETGLPDGMWSVLPVPNDRMEALVQDPRLAVISFTGSSAVGWRIRKQLPDKHVLLELGGNAAVIVTGDADVSRAGRAIAEFGHYQAGQSCIAVQRVLADSRVYEELVETIAAATSRLAETGFDDHVGPLIDRAAAERVSGWVSEAVEAGATLVTGGGLDGVRVTPTVLTGVPSTAKVMSEEVFGPVISIQPYDDLEDAFAVVNDSQYGLQAGIFTKDIRTAMRAHRELEVGGVIVGDVPSYRSDRMPYGGVKASGIGREGVRYAMEDFTHQRVLVLSGLDL